LAFEDVFVHGRDISLESMLSSFDSSLGSAGFKLTYLVLPTAVSAGLILDLNWISVFSDSGYFNFVILLKLGVFSTLFSFTCCSIGLA